MFNGKRLYWVDSAKGISIILVVMLYAANSVGKATGEVGFLHYIIGFATPFRMPEFFLISGLFLSNVIARNWESYLDKRFVHYLYFYGLWALIMIVIKIALYSAHPSHALSLIIWSIVEPYSMLWFIYVLAFFSLTAKIAYSLKIPHWAMLIGAALLHIFPIQTPSYAINQFAEYLIYFYAGYVFAPLIFKIVQYFLERPLLSIASLSLWAIINGALVFSPSFKAMPTHFEMGYAALPVLHLGLALIGAMAVCVLAAFVSRFNLMNWLHWVGSHSIVIFLAFGLPLGLSREILLRFNLIDNIGIFSLVILLVALIAPLILYWLVQKTGYGKFLFERPAWAHISSTKQSLSPKIKKSQRPKLKLNQQAAE